MTTSLLSSLIRMGLLILAPWLVFSKPDKVVEAVSVEQQQVENHSNKQRKQKRASRDVPVHSIQLYQEEIDDQTGQKVTEQLVEYGTAVKEVLTVCWRALSVYFSALVGKVTFHLTPKQKPQQEPTMTVRDFNSDEINVLKGYKASPLINSLLYHALPASKSVKQEIPDVYPLQFAAMTDDVSAQKCLEELGDLYEPGRKHGLFGMAERKNWREQPWEHRLKKHKQGVNFMMERKYWRDGLYLYRSIAVFKYARVEDYRRFIMNSAERMDWDWSTLDLKRLQNEAESAEVPAGCESCFLYTENKMPGPICNREYVAARRVWSRSDGGCYSITKSALHPMAPPRKGRNVRVEDFSCAFVIRPLNVVDGEKMNAVEMTSLYFDNAKMRPMAYNLAMNASMWTGIITTDNGFRKFQTSLYPIQSSPTTSEVQEDGVDGVVGVEPLQLQTTERRGQRGLFTCLAVAGLYICVTAVKGCLPQPPRGPPTRRP